jgi:hypothetical protein
VSVGPVSDGRAKQNLAKIQQSAEVHRVMIQIQLEIGSRTNMGFAINKK